MRAVRKPDSSERIASCWFLGAWMDFDITITDGQAHKIAFYFMDWDTDQRTQQVEVIDPATNTVLDSHDLQGFEGGRYLIWNVSGIVRFRISNTGPTNAVVNGIFFGGGSSAAEFVAADDLRQGNWMSGYGSEGYVLAGDASSLPAYAAAPAPNGHSQVTWEVSTSDVRGLQKPSGGRIAASWYAATSMTVNLDVSAGEDHLTTFYFLDWQESGRSQLVEILDSASQTVLDSREISDFGDGLYLSYRLTGNVTLRLTSTAPTDAVVSGIFFGTGSATAEFVDSDATTQGNWRRFYGREGYHLFASASAPPAYATISAPGVPLCTWASSTSDPRAPTKTSTTDERTATCAFTYGSLSIEVDLNDGLPHQMAAYFLDWDHIGRVERVDLKHAETGALLDSRTISDFSGGLYLIWNVSGRIRLDVTFVGGINSVITGLFFGDGINSATFLARDDITQGYWTGGYGVEGHAIAGLASALPSYANLATDGTVQVIENPSADPRGVRKPGGSERIAANWHHSGVMTFDLNLTDAHEHKVALYAVDWDLLGASQMVEIVDADTGAVLDSRTLTDFSGGAYLSWDILGHVHIRVTHTGPGEGIVNAVFFGGGATSAEFAGADTNHQGYWMTSYGEEGYLIVNHATELPAYATLTPTGHSSYTWANNPGSPRALQKPTGGDMAATWFSGGSFEIDLNVSPGGSHFVSFFFLDWDAVGRTQTVEIRDAATAALLDTRALSNFSDGIYLSYVVTGHIKVKVINTGPGNAVLSGIFFGAGVASAEFVGTNTTNQGNWRGQFGVDGHQIFNSTGALPAYASVSTAGIGALTWSDPTSDPRAPTKTNTAPERAATALYSATEMSIDLDLSDGATHQMAAYFLDWDRAGRTQTVELRDAASDILLDNRALSNFENGVYLIWNVSGHVKLRIVNTGPGEAVVSGLFFGKGLNGATFVTQDNATQGSWQGVYGGDGYRVVNDSVSYPSYATVTADGSPTFTWNNTTSDVRAMQKGTDPQSRIASCVFSYIPMSQEIEITDGNTHRMAVYCLDWDTNGRTQRIELLNADTNEVLDTRDLANFNGGAWLVWDVTGNVKLKVTNTGPTNAVIGGLFFGP